MREADAEQQNEREREDRGLSEGGLDKARHDAKAEGDADIWALAAEYGQGHGGQQGAHPHRGDEHAEPAGLDAEYVDLKYGHQREDGKEQDRGDDGGDHYHPQERCFPHVAEPGRRLGEGPSRSVGGGRPDRRTRDVVEGQHVDAEADVERRRDAGELDEHPRYRGRDDLHAAKDGRVEEEAVGRGVGRGELANHGLAHRKDHAHEDAREERDRHQNRNGHRLHRDERAGEGGQGQLRDLGGDHHLLAVGPVGQRPAEDGDEEHGDHAEGEHGGDQNRRGGQIARQEGPGDLLHLERPKAEERRQPEIAVPLRVEGAEGGEPVMARGVHRLSARGRAGALARAGLFRL